MRVQRQPEPVSAEGKNRPKIAFGGKDDIYITYTMPLAKPYTGEIRFVCSTDGGKTFSAPLTVHANRDLITHRFESLIVDHEGCIYVAWIDKRDLEAAAAHKRKYAGAALYYAVSEDGGVSFGGDYKIADHFCECCRIALALNPQGHPVAMWRHVFEPNVRDHALAELTPDGKPAPRSTTGIWMRVRITVRRRHMRPTARTSGASDQPHLLNTASGIMLVWPFWPSGRATANSVRPASSGAGRFAMNVMPV